MANTPTPTPTNQPGAPLPAEYDVSKYNTTGMTYPGDLMSSTAEYGGNYVMFFINVHQDSDLAKAGSGNPLVPGVAPSKRNSMDGSNINSAVVVGTAVTSGALAANAANPVGGAANAAGANLSKDTQTAGNILFGAGVAGLTLAATNGVNAAMKRQAAAICLYMPPDLSIRYGAVWDEQPLDKISALMSGISNPLSAGNMVANQALKAPGIGEFLQKSSGTAPNPKKEQLFKEVRFREFSFNYQFFPRSSAEAQSVIKIIREFKLHMHPEFRDQNQFLYIYPSEFDIVYYTGGAPSPHLPKHTSCALTDMTVQFSPQGVFTSFPDGMPTQINISLSFRELALLTKKDIQAGY